MECNGWSNKATWIVSLWFSNDIVELDEQEPVTGTHIRDMVEEIVDSAIDHQGVSGFIRDMMDLNSVNWDELASNYRKERE